MREADRLWFGSGGSDRDGAALAIERYEFRTQGTVAVPLYEETGIRLPT